MKLRCNLEMAAWSKLSGSAFSVGSRYIAQFCPISQRTKGISRPLRRMKRPAAQRRVACLGDSNTVGSSWTARLQELLDARGAGSFRVKAFGVNGAVAADTEGKKCYRKQQRYKDALAFEAQVHVDSWRDIDENSHESPRFGVF